MKQRLSTPCLQKNIRVGIIDDHTLFRESVKRILDIETDIDVVGDSAGRADGLAMIVREKPDILLQDIGLGSADGLAMLSEIKTLTPHLKCLILTGMTENQHILRAIQNRADGFLLKDCSMPALIEAIRKLARGQTMWDPALIARLMETDSKFSEGLDAEGIQSLTASESKIAHLIAEGLTNREIGKRLHLAEKTIRNRISLMMDKLQVTRRAKIAALYTRNLDRPE
jgi:two-component system, NarL family, response regulator DevR